MFLRKKKTTQKMTNYLKIFDPTFYKKLVGSVGATPLPLRSIYLMSGVSPPTPPTNFFEKKLDQKTLNGLILEKEGQHET